MQIHQNIFHNFLSLLLLKRTRKRLLDCQKEKKKILLKSKSAYKHLEQKPMTWCWQTTDIRIK